MAHDRAASLDRGAIGRLCPAHPVSLKELKIVREEWILGQYRYFTDAGKRERARERLSTRLTAASLVLSVALTVSSHAGATFLTLPDSVGVILFAATLLAVAAALIHNFPEKRGWSEHSRHYELMAALFGHAAERTASVLDQTQLDAASMGACGQLWSP